MTIEAGEFHCWYSADIGEARKKGQYAPGNPRSLTRPKIRNPPYCREMLDMPRNRGWRLVDS
jgi:hypothetical protein